MTTNPQQQTVSLRQARGVVVSCLMQAPNVYGELGVLTLKAIESGRFVLVPSELTAGNGAKAELIGEFFESIEVPDPDYCGCGECDYCVEVATDEESETMTQQVPVSWTTIKAIYRKAVDLFSSAN